WPSAPLRPFAPGGGVEESGSLPQPPPQPQECEPLSGSYKVLMRSFHHSEREREKARHFQTMLKTKLNVLTLKKEPLPTVIFHEPEAIELCSTTPLTKSRIHAGYKSVCWTYRHFSSEQRTEHSDNIEMISSRGGYQCGQLASKLLLQTCGTRLHDGSGAKAECPTPVVTISGTQFLSGCTESAVVGLVERRGLAQQQGSCPEGNSLLEIRPFQVRLHHLDEHGEASVTMDTYQVARIAYCTADHSVRPNVFAWIYREINDDLTFQMDCHAVECESKLEAKKLAHSMMEAFRKTFHSMRSDGRIHKSGSSDGFAEDSSTPEDSTPDDG
ncbi:hypothetical protein FQN60_004781, partial [Etheostoma spectabile]